MTDAPVKDDCYFMEMALRIAARGLGNVEPNPAVGCVIVRGGKVLAKGWHKRFGRAHAEVEALRRCGAKEIDPRGATMYVTLEPCCHTGKTGPCTQAIIEAGIAEVVVATEDPAEYVAGKGIKALRQAGISVRMGPLRREAQMLNAPFFKFARTGRPWVILKWAQSSDGYLGSKQTRWISGELSREDVHRLRKKVQAILVGIGTVLADDPLLTVRIAGEEHVRQPLRVVLDSGLRIPLKARVLNDHTAPTLVVTTPDAVQKNPDKVDALGRREVELIAPPCDSGRCSLEEVLVELGRRGVQQLLVEGGPTVLDAFLAADLADAVQVYIAPTPQGDAGLAPVTAGMAHAAEPETLHHTEVRQIGEDRCISGILNLSYIDNDAEEGESS